MDDNYKKSLVSRVLEKGIVTPWEAIYLQHLNTRYIQGQSEKVIHSDNFYTEIENIQGLISPLQFKQLLTFTGKYNCNLYDAYKWIATDLMNFETGIGEIGYRGIALLNEIRYAKDENCLRVYREENSNVPLGKLLGYRVYSRVNKKWGTFADLLKSFGMDLYTLIMTIDIVLTDNYYLDNMFELEELNCLKYLKMWITQDEMEENISKEDEFFMEPPFNIVGPCCKNSLDDILRISHSKLTEMIRMKVNSFDLELAPEFEKCSLDYVKSTIKNILDSVVSENSSSKTKIGL